MIIVINMKEKVYKKTKDKFSKVLEDSKKTKKENGNSNRIIPKPDKN